MHGRSCQGLLLENMGKNLAAGVVPRSTRPAEAYTVEVSHNPAPTSTPTSRPSTPRFRPSVTIPSFHPGPSVPPILLQNATKSATSLNHPNRLNSPEYTTYLSACQIHVHMSIKVPEFPCPSTRNALPASPRFRRQNRTRTGQTALDWPRLSFVELPSPPIFLPLTTVHSIVVLPTKLIGVTSQLDDSPLRPTRRGMTSVSRHACEQFSSAS